MKRLLITMVRLFFYQRIVYWLVVTAVLLVAGSLLLPRGLAMPVRFLAIALVTGFPLFAVAAQFAAAASNRHFAAIPYGRHFLLGATFCLTVMLNALFSLNLTWLPMPGAPEFTEIFPVFFFGFSWLLVVVSCENKIYAFLPVALIVVFHEPLLAFWQQLPGMKTPILQSGLVLISLLGWLWLALKLRRTGSIVDGSDQSSRLSGEQNMAVYIGGTMTDHAQLSGVQTLVYKLPCSRSTRFWITAMQFLVLPAAISGLLWFFINPAAWNRFLIIVQFYLIAFVAVTTAEWIASLRVLWLKIPGDRLEFWRLWKKLVRTELLLSMLMLGSYGVGMVSIVDVSDTGLALYSVMVVLFLPSLCFCVAWFRIRGAFENNRAVWGGVVYVLTVIPLIVASFAMETYTPVIWLASLSGSMGLLAYFRVRSGFLTLDWLQVRSRS